MSYCVWLYYTFPQTAQEARLDPRVIVTDKLNSDEAVKKQILKSVETYQGATLFVTHNLEEAYRVCQDLLVME